MKNYCLVLFCLFFASVGQANENDIASSRANISSSLNDAVATLKGYFFNVDVSLKSNIEETKILKENVEDLVDRSSKGESNPTVLDHGRSTVKELKYCNYDSQNIHWTGTEWKCQDVDILADCIPARDEYRVSDSNSSHKCQKHASGQSIKYYWKFNGYTKTCSSTTGLYGKIYGCYYKNKLNKEIQVDNSNCNGKSKPSSANSSCDTFRYVVGTWGSCSAKACGTSGYQTRTVTCVNSRTNAAVAGSNCSGTVPTTSQVCYARSCSYSWSYGGWGSCSATACGTSGKETRSYKCINDSTKATVSNNKCSGSAYYSRNCSTAACKDTYSWSYGGWGSCSATSCGTSGQQTRSYKCINNRTGSTVSNSKCSGSPYYSKACTNAPCKDTFKWSYGNWGNCSATACGTSGSQTRSYKCINERTGSTVGNSNCAGSADARQVCSARACKPCSISHPMGWTVRGDYCAEYYAPAGGGNIRKSTLSHGRSATFAATWSGTGTITLKCEDGYARITSKKCRKGQGGIIANPL
tara:strand:+ start:348 stop:1922 length:1575 start_codon:yes stop_codon:yes gene_type:complete